MPERVYAVIHFQGKKHSFPITRCCDSLYRTVRKYVNFIVKDENRELYWKDEWSSYYVGSAKDLSTAVEWMKKNGNRPSWEPLHIHLYVGEKHMNEQQRKESDTPMNVPVHFELYFNGAKYRFYSNHCSSCCDTLYHTVRQYVDSIVGDTSLELFWKDEWSSYLIGSEKELSIAIEWMKKNTKKDSTKPLRICLFVGDNNHMIEMQGKEVEKPFVELIYFELKFNGKTRFFSEHRCGPLFTAVRKYVDSMVGEKTTELVWKDEWSSYVIGSEEDLYTAIKWTKKDKKISPLKPVWIRLFIEENRDSETKSTEEEVEKETVDETIEEVEGTAKDEKEETPSAYPSFLQSSNNITLPSTMLSNEPQMSTEDHVNVDESLQEQQNSSETSSMEEELLQPLPSNEEQENARQDLVEREISLKIREKELQLKEEIFERKVAEFQLRMEEFEEKLNELEWRIDDVEYDRDIDQLESRMDEMEDRLMNVEDSVME